MQTPQCLRPCRLMTLAHYYLRTWGIAARDKRAHARGMV